MKINFVLSHGYATLPEPLQFVYTMVTTLAEGRLNVIIPAPNRIFDPNNYYPLRSELPAVWVEISNAIQGFKDCSTIRAVLDEVLGLEFSNFTRLLKLSQQVTKDLWFRQVDYARNAQGEDGQKKSDISGRGAHGTGLEDEVKYQFMVVLITESVCLGRRRF